MISQKILKPIVRYYIPISHGKIIRDVEIFNDLDNTTDVFRFLNNDMHTKMDGHLRIIRKWCGSQVVTHTSTCREYKIR
jgi:hypothetical protein